MKKTGFVLLLFFASKAWAGVFNIPHYTNESTFSAGFEPELTLTGNASAGINAKLTYGLSDSLNLGGAIGTGGGDRGFRLGSYLVADIFPDVEEQPGIGIAGQVYYQKFLDSGQLEVTAVPYLHKAFYSGSNTFDPFVAIPIGRRFASEEVGGSRGLLGVSVGSIFQQNEHLQFVMELGVAVHNTETTVSGGIVYQQ